MVTTPNLSDDHLTAARRAKLAYIYVHQSSLTQVKHHQESTELQYRLVERAEAWGWPRERIQVIDEDLGKSGAGTTWGAFGPGGPEVRRMRTFNPCPKGQGFSLATVQSFFGR